MALIVPEGSALGVIGLKGLQRKAMKQTILVVEDEPDIAATVAFNLKKEGYEVHVACTGEEALLIARDVKPALVLLDVMLPGISGTEVCQKLRQDPQSSAAGIIMLSAKGDEIDRVVGLELGADDYVVKPFSVRELMLRVRTLLKRTASHEEAREEVASFGILRVDVPAHRVFVSESEVTLTSLEFKLLHLLFERRGRVQSRERLLETVWKMPGELTTRTVDTHVKRLRQKIGPAGEYIQTVRGVGYRFRDSLD